MKLNYYDIHRHDQFSLFDGFGKADQAAKRAKELGYPALGLTNHGNITGLIKHYKACEANDIIPILGCEFYFQPKINHEKPYYHLCLFASSLEGWQNLNKLISVANYEENFHYKPKLDFKALEKYNAGLLCSSACIAGPISQALVKGNHEAAERLTQKFVDIFDDRFFIEVQPFELHGEDVGGKGMDNLQMKINLQLLDLADEYGVDPIITSDSHYILKEDFDTYLKLHAIKDSKLGQGYSERFMPSPKSMAKRTMKFCGAYVERIAQGMETYLDKIGDSRGWFRFVPMMPQYTGSPEATYNMMVDQCTRFLKVNKKFTNKYREKLDFEFDVIKTLGFQDYFMIVQDYVNWAKQQGIAVGPGRGSAGNSLVNYALGITVVDPVYFDNDFNRFLRKDKKKFPDIDVDFGQDRRDEVINYIVSKYKGKAAQTLTYGMYNVKNLVNDLAKVCGCDDKAEADAIKKYLSQYCNDSENAIDVEGLVDDAKYTKYNYKYDNIIKHFIKMYGQVRYFGTHASSVIISPTEIEKEAGLVRIGGKYKTSFDLHDIEYIGLLKLDILGLSSATKALELERLTGEKFSYEMLNDPGMLKQFNEDATGIFQFESKSSIELINMIGVNNFEDIVASVALNRPGPLALGMHEQYAQNKLDPPKDTPWYKYTKKSYGTLIYQEQVMAIAKALGNYTPADADAIAKHDSAHIPEAEEKRFRKLFVKNAIKNGLDKQTAEEIFRAMLGYSFNRGHAVAYSMLSAELGYFKKHYPDEFWFITLKYEGKEENAFRDEALYINQGGLIMLPHVNGPIRYGLVDYEGEKVIQKGLITIKGVGQKAAEVIEAEREKNGDFTDLDEFLVRCKHRAVNKKVLDALEDAGALCFNKKKWLKQVEKYNTSILARR